MGVDIVFVIILILLLFSGGWGYYGYSRGGPYGVPGILVLFLLVILFIYLVRGVT